MSFDALSYMNIGFMVYVSMKVFDMHKIVKHHESKMLYLEQQIYNIRFEKDISSLKSQVEDLKNPSTELCKDT